MLKGFGQIMLQGNVITGLFFILAIFYDSYMMGIAGVISMRCRKEIKAKNGEPVAKSKLSWTE